jgi:Zn-dependent oligopeptidase
MDDVRSAGCGLTRQTANARRASGAILPRVGQARVRLNTMMTTLFHERSGATACSTCRRKINERDVSLISGVEWGSGIELPSQFMEEFCWEWDAR